MVDNKVVVGIIISFILVLGFFVLGDNAWTENNYNLTIESDYYQNIKISNVTVSDKIQSSLNSSYYQFNETGDLIAWI